MSRADVIAAVCALAAHVDITYDLAHVPMRQKPGSNVVEIEVRKKELPPPPPQLTPPEPPKEPPPPPPR